MQETTEFNQIWNFCGLPSPSLSPVTAEFGVWEWVYSSVPNFRLIIVMLCSAKTTNLMKFWNLGLLYPLHLQFTRQGQVWHSRVAHNVLGAKFHIDRFLHPWGAKTLNLNLTVCKFSILSWPHLAAQWQSWTRCRTTKLPLPTISNPFLNSSSLMAISVRKLYRSKVWQERNKRNIEFF